MDKTKRTLLLDILRKCRKGLNLRQQQYVSVLYEIDGLETLFCYEDGKLYRLKISEVEENGVTARATKD